MSLRTGAFKDQGKQAGQGLGLWGAGQLTHSKCFLIFSDSAYLEMPLMKRVRLTWGWGSGKEGWWVFLLGAQAQRCQKLQGGVGAGCLF